MIKLEYTLVKDTELEKMKKQYPNISKTGVLTNGIHSESLYKPASIYDKSYYQANFYYKENNLQGKEAVKQFTKNMDFVFLYTVKDDQGFINKLIISTLDGKQLELEIDQDQLRKIKEVENYKQNGYSKHGLLTHFKNFDFIIKYSGLLGKKEKPVEINDLPDGNYKYMITEPVNMRSSEMTIQGKKVNVNYIIASHKKENNKVYFTYTDTTGVIAGVIAGGTRKTNSMKGYEKRTVAELKALARKRGIKSVSGMKKVEVIAVLRRNYTQPKLQPRVVD